MDRGSGLLLSNNAYADMATCYAGEVNFLLVFGKSMQKQIVCKL